MSIIRKLPTRTNTQIDPLWCVALQLVPEEQLINHSSSFVRRGVISCRCIWSHWGRVYTLNQVLIISPSYLGNQLLRGRRISITKIINNSFIVPLWFLFIPCLAFLLPYSFSPLDEPSQIGNSKLSYCRLPKKNCKNCSINVCVLCLSVSMNLFYTY